MLKIGLFAARHTIYVGADGNVLYIDRNVKASTAGADLAARLGTLAVPAR